VIDGVRSQWVILDGVDEISGAITLLLYRSAAMADNGRIVQIRTIAGTHRTGTRRGDRLTVVPDFTNHPPDCG
jgi:hypothetical protein